MKTATNPADSTTLLDLGKPYLILSKMFGFLPYSLRALHSESTRSGQGRKVWDNKSSPINLCKNASDSALQAKLSWPWLVYAIAFNLTLIFTVSAIFARLLQLAHFAGGNPAANDGSNSTSSSATGVAIFIRHLYTSLSLTSCLPSVVASMLSWKALSQTFAKMAAIRVSLDWSNMEAEIGKFPARKKRIVVAWDAVFEAGFMILCILVMMTAWTKIKLAVDLRNIYVVLSILSFIFNVAGDSIFQARIVHFTHNKLMMPEILYCHHTTVMLHCCICDVKITPSLTCFSLKNIVT
jgi:hypothetical protein